MHAEVRRIKQTLATDATLPETWVRRLRDGTIWVGVASWCVDPDALPRLRETLTRAGYAAEWLPNTTGAHVLRIAPPA